MGEVIMVSPRRNEEHKDEKRKQPASVKPSQTGLTTLGSFCTCQKQAFRVQALACQRRRRVAPLWQRLQAKAWTLTPDIQCLLFYQSSQLGDADLAILCFSSSRSSSLRGFKICPVAIAGN
jgi:hypothetical protein